MAETSHAVRRYARAGGSGYCRHVHSYRADLTLLGDRRFAQLMGARALLILAAPTASGARGPRAPEAAVPAQPAEPELAGAEKR